MIIMTRAEALERFRSNKEVYRLYDDGSEALCETEDDILDERFADNHFAREGTTHVGIIGDGGKIDLLAFNPDRIRQEAKKIVVAGYGPYFNMYQELKDYVTPPDRDKDEVYRENCSNMRSFVRNHSRRGRR